MAAMAQRLAAAGARGVHLGVDPGNTGALAFYERLGYRELDAPEGGRFFGLRLDPTAPRNRGLRRRRCRDRSTYCAVARGFTGDGTGRPGPG